MSVFGCPNLKKKSRMESGDRACATNLRILLRKIKRSHRIAIILLEKSVEIAPCIIHFYILIVKQKFSGFPKSFKIKRSVNSSDKNRMNKTCIIHMTILLSDCDIYL